MTIAIKERRRLMWNLGGVCYSIPENEVDLFIQMDESISNSEWDSKEYNNLVDEFNRQFGEYEKDQS